jgi:hypothetical protein
MKSVDGKIVVATAVSWLLSIGLCLVSWSAWAEDAESEEPADTTTQETTRPTKPGFYTDDFHILPEAQLSVYYDDNIYATERAQESDIVTILTPQLKITSRWDRHSLKLNAGANIGLYKDNSAEDYEDYWFKADGRYEVSAATRLFGELGYNKKHEGRDSRESSRSGEEPTTYDIMNLQGGIRQSFGDMTVRLVATYEELDFDNVGDLLNDDRDRRNAGLGLRVSRNLGNRTSLHVQGLLNDRDYEIEQNGINRDSSGYAATLGLIRNFAKKDRIEAYAGLLSQDYDESSFDTVTAPVVGFNFRWYPSEGYKVAGSLNRSLNETTELGASGYLYTSLNLQLEKKMLTNYVGYVTYTHGIYDYQDMEREDTYNALTLGLSYYMSQHVLISGSYSYYDNDSNDAILNPVPGESYDYQKNLFLLSLRIRLAP